MLRDDEKCRFGRTREDVYQIKGDICIVCGMSEKKHLSKYSRSLHIHHIDRNGRYSKSANNNLNNLEVLCSRCHRNRHKNDTKYCRGDKHGRAKVKASDVLEMRSLKNSGWTCRAISKKYPITEEAVRLILHGVTWKHLAKQTLTELEEK